MPIGLRLISGPAVEPVLLDATFRARLRLDGSADDADVEAMIAAARELCESETQRAFITQTWSLFLDEFPAGGDEIRLPKPPLQSVTWIKYYDADGDLQTLDAATYFAATASEPGRIWPAAGSYWPAVQSGRPEAVEVRFVAGYGAAGTDCPKTVQEAIRLIVVDRYTHRGDDSQTPIPPAARRLLDSHEYGECW